MKNSQKGLISWLSLILIGILIIAGLFFYYQINKAKVNTITPVDNSVSKCGLKVTSLTPNEKVNFPLTISGVVDNSNAKNLGCSWQMFEGQAGVAKLYFYNNGVWNIINSGVPIEVIDWMATTTNFSFVLDENVSVSSDSLMKVTFVEENPSGQGLADTLEIPIIFGGNTNLIYTNSNYRFTFAYPKEFMLADEQVISDQAWQSNTTDSGNLIVRVLIPRTIQPKTNFGEANFDVGVSTSSLAIKNCLLPPMGNGVQTSNLVINGIDFTVFHYNDAGAGNLYDVTSYHSVHNGKCFVLESMIHSSNIGNYSPDQGIGEFDKASIDNILKSIVNSFKFQS